MHFKPGFCLCFCPQPSLILPIAVCYQAGWGIGFSRLDVSSCEYQERINITKGRTVQFTFTCTHAFCPKYFWAQILESLIFYVFGRVQRCTYYNERILDFKLVSPFLFSNNKTLVLCVQFFLNVLFLTAATLECVEKMSQSPLGVHNISAHTRLHRNIKQ